MKKISAIFIYILFITLSFNLFLYADEIYLKDGTIIKCKITRITADLVYFSKNEKENETIALDSTSQIIYSDKNLNIENNNKQSQQKTNTENLIPKDNKLQNYFEKIHYYLLVHLSFGRINNPDIPDWTFENSNNYLSYLKNQDLSFQNYSVKKEGEQRSDWDGYTGLGINLRAFYKYFGIGLELGYFGDFYSTNHYAGSPEITIIDQNGKKFANILANINYSFYIFNLFFKYPIVYNQTTCLYLIFGIGIGKYYGKYSMEISAASGSGSLYDTSNFTKTYKGETYGYNINFEFGTDLFEHLSAFAGIKITKGSFDSFKSGNSEMKFNNGKKAQINLDSFEIFFGTGVYF
jgi:hypothetical protein